MENITKKWEEIKDKYIAFHTNIVIEDVANKVKYYLKDARLNALFDSISEQFAQCREWFDEFFKKTLPNKEDIFYFNNAFCDFLNRVYIFTDALRRFYESFTKIYKFVEGEDPYHLFEASNENCFHQICQFRKFFVHSLSLSLSKSNLEAIFLENEKKANIKFESLARCRSKTPSNVIDFLLLSDIKRFEFFVNWNRAGAHLFLFNFSRPKELPSYLQVSLIYERNKVTTGEILFNCAEIMSRFLKDLEIILDKFNNKKNYKKHAYKQIKRREELSLSLYKFRENKIVNDKFNYFDIKIAHKYYSQRKIHRFEMIWIDKDKAKETLITSFGTQKIIYGLEVGKILNLAIPKNTYVRANNIINPYSLKLHWDGNYNDLLIFFSIIYLFEDEFVEFFFLDQSWRTLEDWNLNHELLPINGILERCNRLVKKKIENITN